MSGQKTIKGKRTVEEEVLLGRKCGRRRPKLEAETSVPLPRPQENVLDYYV